MKTLIKLIIDNQIKDWDHSDKTKIATKYN